MPSLKKQLSEEPCRYFDKYKAIRPPKCSCFPCHDKYDGRQKAIQLFGKDTVEMAESIVNVCEAKDFMYWDVCRMLKRYKHNEFRADRRAKKETNEV